MRPPSSRVFAGSHSYQHHCRRRRTYPSPPTSLLTSRSCVHRTFPQHWSLTFGIDVPLTESLITSLQSVLPNGLPPFLALTYLCQCWTAWMATRRAASFLTSSDDGTTGLDALLAVSEQSLVSYLQLHARPKEGSHGYCLIVEHMLRVPRDAWSVRTLASILQYATKAEDTEGAILAVLVDLLALSCGRDVALYESSLRTVLGASLPVHVAPLVRTILRPRAVRAEVVKLCLHHVAVVVRGRHRGALSIETVMGGFHECAIMALRWLLADPARGPRHGEMCIQVMSCLKHAPLFVLCEVYTLFEARGLLTPSVQCKFLANCGLAAAGSPSLPEDMAAVVVRAFCALTRCGREVRHIEEGLVHGSAALLAAQRADLVRGAYAALPALRETPHAVLAHVRSGAVADACRALRRLATSRAEGWLNIPPITLFAAHAVCGLVGRIGAPGDVAAVYAALVDFHNPGMILAQGVECVVAGIAERIRRIAMDFSVDTPPRAMVEHVLPILRATATHLGDDVNTDAVLAVIEAAVCEPHFAVPLTAAVVRTLQRATSLAMRELFLRVNATTNGLPFLSYYALCYARDSGRLDVVEHLAAVWHCDAEIVLRRHAKLAPMCKLWKCSACARLNSDRFNYCLCSALRNGFVLCSRCGYAQDERWGCCQSCGGSVDVESITAAIIRKAWRCDACGAANSARQTHRCFRCVAQCGPVAQAVAKHMENIPGMKCNCNSKDDNTTSPYCRQCGWVREVWAKENLGVWRCTGCGSLHSVLDRVCPECPQVDCLPAAQVLRPGEWPMCSKCHKQGANRFASNCTFCGGAWVADVNNNISAVGFATGQTEEKSKVMVHGCDEVHLTRANEEHSEEHSHPRADMALRCVNCGSVSHHCASEDCADCGQSLQDAEFMHIASRHCEKCGIDVHPLHVAALCTNCAAFIEPVPREGWSAAVVCSTFDALLPLLDANHLGLRAVSELLQLLLAAVSREEVPFAALDGGRVGVAVSIARLQARLIHSIVDDIAVRRTMALARQFLEQMDRFCGVVGVSHFAEGECRQCLGTHREEWCVYAAEAWTCESCGAESNNADVCRYVCRDCLALRPSVRDAAPSETWECQRCQRANMVFETYCIFCDSQRAAMEGIMDRSAEVFPFLPAKCDTCGLVYLETRCPLCQNTLPEKIQESEGVICLVTSRYAFIQPAGTDHPNQRVYVAERWLRRRKLVEGEKVIFTAQINEHGGFRVTSLQS